MRRNNILIILLIILVLSLLTGAILAQFHIMKRSFFTIRFIELLQLIVTVVIAVFITRMINRTVTNDTKKREILDSLFSRSQIDLSELIKLGYDYIANPNKEKEKAIVSKFKHLSIMMGMIKDLKGAGGCPIAYDDSLYGEFLQLKELLTDTPFGQKAPRFSPAKVDQIGTQYGVLSTKLYACRLTRIIHET